MKVILTYKDTGSKRPCGQTVGANGAGAFAIIFNGDDEKAIHDEIKKILDRIDHDGRLDGYCVVWDGDHFSGPAIRTINL